MVNIEMTQKKSFQTENPLEHYTEFWSEALQRIDTIQNLLYSECANLELKYKVFEDQYDIITNLTKEMVSLYSGFNTLKGHEDLMRLKTIIERYEERYTRKGIDFDIIHHLLNKVSTLRAESFDNFPAVEHLEYDKTPEIKEKSPRVTQETSYFNRPFKWLSFSRNSSSFMIAFETFKIISNNGFSIEEKDSTNKIFNAYNNEINFSYKDLMSPQDSFIEPAIFICIDNEFYYPAEKILKKIFAHNDFLSEKIEDFDAHHEKPFLGRVKIFGINHIFLQEEKAYTHP